MQSNKIDSLIDFIRNWYDSDQFIPLHEPRFQGNEKNYLCNTIDSTYVSSVGEYVDLFEQKLATYTGAKHAVATVNGTCALQISLLLAGVQPEDEVITQSFTFIATANAIKYCSAKPVFIDIDNHTLGLSVNKLSDYLKNHCHLVNGNCYNKVTGNRIAACLPAHIFGEPLEIDKIVSICNDYGLPVIEDAAETLGSFCKKRHCGTLGLLGTLSFNGNKIITTGGGGVILTNDKSLAIKAKHLTTTAKIPHSWKYDHDQIGFNYRLPNVNAALGCAQLEQLNYFLTDKKLLAKGYKNWCDNNNVHYINNISSGYNVSNLWLNAILLKDEKERDEFLKITNKAGVMTRPAWTPMHKLPIYKDSIKMDLSVTEDYASRLVNLPSSARLTPSN